LTYLQSETHFNKIDKTNVLVLFNMKNTWGRIPSIDAAITLPYISPLFRRGRPL